ncbi:MAG TPA: hypothetical protein VGX23_09275 [Actinocrinis sp.]|nr:hypothetical protein [Actinocrinis sp.]
MSWGEPQQPNQEPEPGGPWGNPAGPEETAPYGAPPGPYGPPGPSEGYHSAPTQMYGGTPPQPPQQPEHPAPTLPYGQQAQQPPYGAPPQNFGPPTSPYGAQPPQYGGGFPPQTEPPKKKNGLVIGLIVLAVVVVVGGGVAIATHKSNPPAPPVAQSSSPAPVLTTTAPDDSTTSPEPTATPTGGGGPGDVSLPQSAGGLTQLTTSSAQASVSRVKAGLTSAGGDAAAVYQNALVGAYGPVPANDPPTILVVQPFTNLSSDDASQFEDSDPSDLVGGIMSGADATNVKTVDSSDSDAALSCGNVSSGGTKFYMCSWVDEDTFGVTYFYDNPDPTTAGQQTDALRNGADGD